MFSSICRCSSNLLKTTASTSTTAATRSGVQLSQRAAANGVIVVGGGRCNCSNATPSPGSPLRSPAGPLVELAALPQTSRAGSNFTSQRMASSTSGATTPTPTAAAAPKHTNRLALERSPYLLQHAHNPVDWYPWGDEAIERARRENKLIFLSVGYSTCHWCHVMEHESFESETVAALMNENFVNVKVDREERPDIDKIYMQFVLMMNGSGGWPMSVWLTPDLAPITAGTYFPPHDRWGMPSFSTVLRTIADKWRSDEAKLKATGVQVIAAIRRELSEKAPSAADDDDDDATTDTEGKMRAALHIFRQRHDEQHGGFGSKPKFPEVSRLNFLFHAFIAGKDGAALDMAVQTLQHIGRGGIHDHVFGGFARYAVDRQWHVPHFEKMLYDQGQLMAAFANAYKLTRLEQFARYGDGIFRYLMSDLRHPGGGFYAGEDADSLPPEAAGAAAGGVKVEGAFYAWSWQEVRDVLCEPWTAEELEQAGGELPAGGPERAFEIYARHYDLKEGGNVKAADDPHGHLTGKNILIVRGSERHTAEHFKLSAEQLRGLLAVCNGRLHRVRSRRPRPHLDTKIICAWNGLVLSGLAKLANCGGPRRPAYMQAAGELVAFVRAHLFEEGVGAAGGQSSAVLRRSCYGRGGTEAALAEHSGERIDGFLDDYAFLIRGLLDYYKASLDEASLQWARQLQDIQDGLFWDERNGAYFYSQANAPNVIVRLKEDHDGAEPCGNSVSARNLLLLSHYFDEAAYRERASKLFGFFIADNSHAFGYQLPEMLSALLLQENGLNLVAVVGPKSERTEEFVAICRKFYIPGMIIVRVDPQQQQADDAAAAAAETVGGGDESAVVVAAYRERIQRKFKMVNGQTTVYICQDRVCRMPVTDPAKLEANLNENFFRALPDEGQ